MANTFPFYYKNYRANAELQALPFHSHGVFLALLCIEAKSPERGYLLTVDGQPADTKRLLRLIGRPNYKLARFEADLQDLITCETVCFDEQKKSYCFPFILKIQDISKKRSEAGKQGFAAANEYMQKPKKPAYLQMPATNKRPQQLFDRDQFPAMIERMKSDRIWLEAVLIRHGVKAADEDSVLEKFRQQLVTSGCVQKEFTDAQSHFNNWLNTQRHVSKKVNTHSKISSKPGTTNTDTKGGISGF